MSKTKPQSNPDLSKTKTAVLVGATGLVGGYLVNELAAHYAQVVCIVRRKPHAQAPQLNVAYEVLEGFTELGVFIDRLSNTYAFAGCDAFSTLGTTQKQAGGRAGFFAVDFDYNLAFAHACVKLGAKRFFLLSSVGANAKSKSSFYLRTKGKLEEAVVALGYEYVCIFQPSLLLGAHEGRLLENAAQSLFAMVKSVVPSTFGYRPIEAQRVAKAMVHTATKSLQTYSSAKVVSNSAQVVSNADMLAITLGSVSQ